MNNEQYVVKRDGEYYRVWNNFTRRFVGPPYATEFAAKNKKAALDRKAK